MRPFFFLVGFLMFSFVSHAQPLSIDPPSVETDAPTGEIVFIRSTGYNEMWLSFKTFINDDLASRLNNNRFSRHVVPVGKHQYSTQYFGKNKNPNRSTSNIKVEAGKTHYIMLVTKTSWNDRLTAVEISEASALKMIPTLKEDKNY